MPACVACFGEVLLRLAPSDGGNLRDARRLDLHVGGAEANVAVALANLGIASRMVTALPDNPLGLRALKALRADGVDTRHIATGDGRMGTYFLTPAAGPRGGEVVYDRAGSAFASMAEYAAQVLDDATHLHVSGISLAASGSASRAARALAAQARERGMTVSFDGNFRPSLWSLTDREPRGEIAELMGLADLAFANHRDASLLLGRAFSGKGAGRRRDAALAFLDAFPNLEAVASTARTVGDDGVHRITARIDRRDGDAQSRERELRGIVDRIGTGDAFAAGVLAAWLDDRRDLQAMADGGSALCALKHYEAGDFCRASRAEWQAAQGATSDVAR